ncbi:hypothetical protein BRC86_05535, partial [Halobacteriales archaeon QS_3_64_16]
NPAVRRRRREPPWTGRDPTAERLCGRGRTVRAVIVVATADFEVYHDVVAELRDRDVRFTTVEPCADLPDAARVAVVGPADETPDVPTVRFRRPPIPALSRLV